jgi:hypothetical protein
MPKAHWSRATGDHKERLRELLLEQLDSNGGILPGSVTRSNVMCLNVFDLLDMAEHLAKHHGYTQLNHIIEAARTPASDAD